MYDSVRVGDRVVIKETLAMADRSFIGREGIVGVVDAASFVVGVRNLHSEGFTDVIASEVVKASESPTPRPLTASERALYAAENHDWRDEEAAVEKLHRYGIIDAETLSAELRRIDDERRRTAPDKKRTQAAEFAHRILGADALLEDVIGLADWILAETEEKVTGAEQTADHYIFTRGGYIPGPNVGPLVDEQPQEPINPDEAAEVLTREDLEVRSLRVGLDHSADDDVVNLVGDTYLTADEIDTLVDYLRAAKVVHAKRKAASNT